MTAAWLLPGAKRWLLIAAAVVAAVPVARQAWGNLRLRQFSIALLVTVAAACAILIGEEWEAAVVTFLFVLGGYLEDLALERTRSAVRSLLDMRPRTARRKRQDGWVEVPAEAVQAGDTVVILPGDRVPVDGRVSAGRAVLDTAALTGEPLPAEVGPGDEVLSGSVSLGGYLEVVAERVGADTTFQRLIFLVLEAQEQKPRIQRLLDRFARWYTPSVMTAAALLGLFSGNSHLALTFLVIACPGALVVAAPVAVVAGLGRAARAGILIKGGERLERIGQVDVVTLDKTGTLTYGKPRVTAVIPFDGFDTSTVLALAAAAEQRSEHHLATAILHYARQQGVAAIPATEWRLEPGLGAVAHTSAGLVLVGNEKLLAAHGIQLTPAQAEAVAGRQSRGESVALVAVDGRAAGVIGISDVVREEARQLVPALRRAGVRHTVMLTGDHPAAARRVAEELGIDEVRAGLTPPEKVAAIRSLRAAGHVVAMIGDGINDAPALAAADVSIAMGGTGTEAALEVADITLMSDRLSQVPAAIALSRRIMAVVRQNVAIGVATAVLLLVGALAGRVHLAEGMLVHEASVLAVILNGMRLLRAEVGACGHAPAPCQPESGRNGTVSAETPSCS
ncbi:MAG: heavy metal translocating P-type ATPase [Bacillota bacterium]|nr:MAG: heavy metal translocating P-type ATPase [Bacillota bacterium]